MDNFVESLKENISEQNLMEEVNSNNKVGSFLFISFDLVNSTAFKGLNPKKWPVIFNRFYELVENHALKNFVNSKVWRYAGDEILFYKQIEKISDLYQTPQIALTTINTVLSALNTSYPETKNILYIKSTLWIADAAFIKPQHFSTFQDDVFSNNLIINIDISQNRNIDFLGSDIDLGFRISKFAQRDKIVVSAELAYLLNKHKDTIKKELNYEIDKRLKIVSFEKLKGIWDNRHYPIIWYTESWDTLDEIFLYDEHFNSGIINRLQQNGITKEMHIDRLQKILSEVDNLNKVSNFEKYIQDSAPVEVSYSISQYNKAEVHCVAVCFNKNGNIMIAKRSKNKRRLPDIWDFGCGQLKTAQDFKECLIENYKEDFNLDLIFYDKAIPISTFIMDDELEGRKIPGIIFIAFVKEHTNLKFSKASYSEVDWFKARDLKNICEEDYVADFKDTIRKALTAYKKYISEDT